MDKIRSNNRMNHVTVNSGSDINNRSAIPFLTLLMKLILALLQLQFHAVVD